MISSRCLLFLFRRGAKPGTHRSPMCFCSVSAVCVCLCVRVGYKCVFGSGDCVGQTVLAKIRVRTSHGREIDTHTTKTKRVFLSKNKKNTNRQIVDFFGRLTGGGRDSPTTERLCVCVFGTVRIQQS